MRKDSSAGITVPVYPCTQAALEASLEQAGIQLNDYARMLMDRCVFEQVEETTVRLAFLSVHSLGFREKPTLKEVLARGVEQGLALCPPELGPYARLSYREQAMSANTVLTGQKTNPDGAVILASPLLPGNDELPKGFYLRHVGSELWLRGYVCDDLYRFDQDAVFAFVEQRT